MKGGTVKEELLAEIIITPDGAEEVPLWTRVGEFERLPEGLIVGLTPDVAFVVPFGNPLIRTALIVR